MRYDVDDREIAQVKNYNIHSNQSKGKSSENDGKIFNLFLDEEIAPNEHEENNSCINLNEITLCIEAIDV